jgi:hypothetical protein
MARITHLRVTPSAFRAAKGARNSYSDSQRATTTLTVLRCRAGIKRRRTCAAPRRNERVAKAKRCARYVAVGSFRHTDRAGTNRLHFSGRVRRHPLARGRYRLTAKPKLHRLVGATATTAFRVRRPK